MRFDGQKIAVIHGGLSHERAVSLSSGKAIAKALRDAGHTVVLVDAERDLPTQLRAANPAVVFIALHGTYGEDGRVQGLLDWMGLPYTGEGLEASHRCFHKDHTKSILQAANVPVAQGVVLAEGALAQTSLDALPFSLPVVVKPAAEGSSVGISIVHAAEDWAQAQATAAGKGAVIVEQFIAGPELSVAILGDTVLGTVEVEAAHGFYDYEAKYTAGSGTHYHLPPRLPARIVQQVEALALKGHRALGCHSITRTDFIVGADGPIALEVNTLPGMTATSLVPKIAAAKGLSFVSLLEAIIDRAAHGPDREDCHG